MKKVVANIGLVVLWLCLAFVPASSVGLVLILLGDTFTALVLGTLAFLLSGGMVVRLGEWWVAWTGGNAPSASRALRHMVANNQSGSVLLRRIAVSVVVVLVSWAVFIFLWIGPWWLGLVTMVSVKPGWLGLPSGIAVGVLSFYASFRLYRWWCGGALLHGRRGIKKGQFGSVTVRSGGPGAQAILKAWGEGNPSKEISRE